MTVPVIVQARRSSSRLPGKVLMQWGDTNLLGTILRELEGLDVWVATSTDASDDAVAVEAMSDGAKVYRGELDDVLGRFLGCIDVMGKPAAVFRVCADRPFVSRKLVDAMISYWQRTPGLTYLAPDDLSTSGEIVSVAWLRWARKLGPDEHVTSRIDYELSSRFPTSVDLIQDYHTLAPC